MFVGTFYHTLESKGRFSLPKSFRGNGANWVLTAGLDGCLFVFESKTFEQEQQKYQQLSYLKADHRAIIRHFAGNASWQEIDSLGRLTISEHLKQYAGLNKQLVIVGALNHLEVWAQERYHQLFDSLTEKVEDISERVSL